MAWSFRKRVKLIPGVYLNFSKRGISTTIGMKGASITFRREGAYLNTGIPGTGLSSRTKLTNEHFQSEPHPSYDPNVSPSFGLGDNIVSVDVEEVTSHDLTAIKSAILSANSQRHELTRDIRKVKSTLALTKILQAMSYIFLIGFLNKKLSHKIKADFDLQKQAIIELNHQKDHSYVTLDVDFDDEIKASYDSVVNSFTRLMNSQCIWDITSADYQDAVTMRSAASILVNKKLVRFQLKNLEDIKSQYSALFFENANGANMYFYPNFIVMKSREGNFGLIDFKDLNFSTGSSRFVETGTVPSDSKIIDTTWAKVNKNGSPDRRFKGNYQIPIVQYGTILLTTASGVNEAYEFSNCEACLKFSSDFANYLKKITALPTLQGPS